MTSRARVCTSVGWFFAFTFALTWLLWLPMLLADRHLIGPQLIGPVPGSLLLALGTAVPSFVALALVARNGGARPCCVDSHAGDCLPGGTLPRS